jgi:hypothetical protein
VVKPNRLISVDRWGSGNGGSSEVLDRAAKAAVLHTAGVGDLMEESTEHAIHDGNEKVFTIAEVNVKRTTGEASACTNRIEAWSYGAAFGKFGESGIDEGFAGHLFGSGTDA